MMLSRVAATWRERQILSGGLDELEGEHATVILDQNCHVGTHGFSYGFSLNRRLTFIHLGRLCDM